jgi:signal transduction histidine kinase/DNA-binding response OmpR family regulator
VLHSLLIVGGPLEGPARDAPWHASATIVSTDALALLLGDPAVPLPAVVVIGAQVAVSLTLVRNLRAAWPACELVFIAAAGQEDDLRRLLGRSMTLGGHWTILAAHDPKLAATIDSVLQNAARRVRLRTTLARANVAIASPRQPDDPQYRRMAQASHYLDQVLAQSRDGFVGLDAGLRLLQWNDSAARQWQVPQRQALGLTGPELPFWSDRLAQAVTQALRGADTAPFEQGDDGGRHFEFGVSSVRDADARLIGVSLVIRDVTERHQRLQQERADREAAARAIDAQRRQLFEMFDLAPGFMSVTRGPQHRLEIFNQAYAELCGITPGTALPLEAAFPALAGQSFTALRDQVYASGVPFVGKACALTTPDGAGGVQQRYIDFIYQPWRDAEGKITGILCQGHDVTEQKQRQDGLLMHQTELEALVARRTADLQVANTALQQSQKLEAIGKLTGGVAHDFNNILQVIGSNLDLMGLDPAVTPALRQRLTGSTAAVERAARLSAQLLAFARRQPLQPVPTNLTATLRGMDDLLRRALGEAVDVDIAVAPVLWNTLIDRHQLENVILNLAINARDAMSGNGQLTIELSNVELDQRYVDGRADLAPGQYILLAVSDTGTGIPAEVLERVFEPFFTTKAEGEGTGLGLSMAYGFVKQSGGHIAIYSEPGHGTTVRIYLPRSLEAEHAMAPPASDAIPPGTETILVVEDDAAVRIAVVDMLKGLGYTVLSAYDAASALAMLESGAAPDLLFTDVVMPGPLRSPELARQARLLAPGIGVLFTSGYTQNAIVHAGRLDTGVELLSKPYRRADLARKVRSVLDARMAPDTTPQRIVLVEDNDDARDMLKELLEMLGYEALCFAAAEKALPHLRASDVLLTDLTLPGMSGIELAERAVALWPGLPVIFASGRLVEGTSVRARILTKPYSLEQLQAVLDEVKAELGTR